MQTGWHGGIRVSVEHESAKAVGIESGKAVGQIQLDDLPRRPQNQV